jgi:hypothetical protein
MDELKPAARAALRNMGDADGPSVEDRERLRPRIFGAIVASSAVAASSAALGAGSAAGASTVAGAKLAWFGPAAVWLAVGGLAGSVVAVSSELVIEKTQPARSAVAAAAPARSRKTNVAAPSSRSSVEVALPDDGPPRAAPRVEPDVRGPRTSAPESGAARPAPVEVPPPMPSIREELALLEQAHRELSQGNPSASLATLDAHTRRFPSGAFTAERTAARVFALCALGQVDRARAVADEFLRAAPASPLVPRIRSSCVLREP